MSSITFHIAHFLHTYVHTLSHPIFGIIMVMTSGSPAEYNPLAVEWYRYFERMLGWKSLGMVLGTGKTEEARKLGGSIA